jgi:hypothetical protein
VRALSVDELVIRQHKVSAVADVKPPLDVDALHHQLVDLDEQLFGIEHHAVADRAAHPFVQDAAGNLVQHKRMRAKVYRVPRVRPALVTHHPVGPLRQHVDELAFALVPPLGADDNNGAIRLSEHGWDRRRLGAKKYAPADRSGR